MLHFDYAFFLSNNIILPDDELDISKFDWKPGDVWEAYHTPAGKFGFRRVKRAGEQIEVQPS